MFHLNYKITNTLNGRIYVGAHQTGTINDAYMGSGILLHQAIAKYGKENFIKEIMWFCSSECGMYELEKLLVNEEFILRVDTYNIKQGGRGGTKGLMWINDGERSIYWNTNISLPDGWIKGRLLSLEERLRWGQAFRGRKHTPEHLEKMRLGASEPKSIEHRRKLSVAKLGKSFGPRSESTKQKMRESALLKNPGFSIVAICPICKKEGQKANISKHHGLDGSRCRVGKKI